MAKGPQHNKTSRRVRQNVVDVKDIYGVTHTQQGTPPRAFGKAQPPDPQPPTPTNAQRRRMREAGNVGRE